LVSAALAAPFSGSARTRTFKTAPSAAVVTPSTRFCPDFGVNRTLILSPPATAAQGQDGCRPGKIN
jgi:hypothetical protein